LSGLDEVFTRSDRMVGRRIAGEYVLVPLVGRGAEVDSILNLNRVAAFIWEALDGRRTGREVVRKMVERFEVEPEVAARDYRDLIGVLRELRAVRPATARP
jgi:hypothetical protein